MKHKPIRIKEIDGLAKYTHSRPLSDAHDIRDRVKALRRAGLVVLGAQGPQSSVPNCYRSAYKTKAPFFVFSADDSAIKRTAANLQNRPNGKRIPAHYYVKGDVKSVSGYRVLSFANGIIDLIPT
tara:strand:+ start:480 stop:854 length:375 start_codon:yes stop_codon:yes gene_type:complete